MISRTSGPTPLCSECKIESARNITNKSNVYLCFPQIFSLCPAPFCLRKSSCGSRNSIMVKFILLFFQLSRVAVAATRF